ncbi:uncharacterized protein A4U43_C05F16360 [Asparagus officinalis]|uniref:Uncharacterized protein n=1 Tax=Asparagus officinalis TaxID=4686 RepID=A0A5P1EXE4_ASPOF|nr:uncharacterized protein A4U43_C05F16360 [Asparagus officinalis]
MSSNPDEAESTLLYQPGSSSSSSTSHRADCHQGFSIQYQPKIFEDIIGHDMVIRALSSAIRLNKISPMYLFYGSPGTGKTSAARIFATALNCESSPAKLCSGYKSSWFEEIHKFLRKATSSGVKVVIIDIKFASESWPWGQLLNLVQENNNKIFILLTEDARTVPRAVSSRCQKYKFSKLSDTDVMSKLSRIVAQEGIEIRKDALKLIARRAEGNLREAENLLDHLALLNMKIDTSTIEQLVSNYFSIF